MADYLVVSPENYRIKSKNAYLRMRNCSPRFKTVLRQRYKERVENSRCKLLDQFRNINDENKNPENVYVEDMFFLESNKRNGPVLEDILQTNKDFNIDEELLYEDVLHEELTQYENWLLQEYESMWDVDDCRGIITCPLCCSGHFENMNNIVSCKQCCSSFKISQTTFEVQDIIFGEVDKHNSQCLSDPAFVKIPSDDICDNLCIVCDLCGYLQIIL